MPTTILLRLSSRHINRRFTQSALFVLGVALGVAVIIAIDIANRYIAGIPEFSRRGLHDLSAKASIRHECGQAAALRAWVSLDALLEQVAAAYGVERDAVLRRHSRGNEARQVLLYLAWRYCRGQHAQAEVGERLGGVSRGAVSRAGEIMKTRLAGDAALRQRVEALERQLTANCK